MKNFLAVSYPYRYSISKHSKKGQQCLCTFICTLQITAESRNDKTRYKVMGSAENNWVYLRKIRNLGARITLLSVYQPEVLCPTQTRVKQLLFCLNSRGLNDTTTFVPFHYDPVKLEGGKPKEDIGCAE